MTTNPALSLDGLDGDELRERVELLLDLSLFRHALAEVRRFPHWDESPEALWQLGRVMHRFAPRSKDRSCAYQFARAMYRTAAASAGDTLLRAEVLVDLGTTYFEEGRLDDAVNELEASRAIAPWKYRVHLGLLAIACAKRDRGEIRRRCRDLHADLPSWHANRDAVALLATEPDFAFLRASHQLFVACFGATPEQLQALHDRYSREALEQALVSFDQREDAPRPELSGLTRVVHGTLAKVGPLCSDGFSNPAILTAALPDRIGL